MNLSFYTDTKSHLVQGHLQLPGLGFTKSPNREGLEEGYKGLETFDLSSPILNCFLGFTNVGLEIIIA